MEEDTIYRRLGEKINSLTVKASWNETLYTILKELYTPEEAELSVKMPYILSTLDRIAKTTGLEKTHVRTILERLCNN
jgi:hypothetical protein